jgi:hypothetical protein
MASPPPADAATAAVFAALKPLVLGVLRMLAGSDGGGGAGDAGALPTQPPPPRRWDVAPLHALAAALPGLDPAGLPRCVEYVFMPLALLLPATLGEARGTSGGGGAPDERPPGAASPDRVREAAWAALGALIDAAGAPAFCASGERVAVALGRALVAVTSAADALTAQPGGAGGVTTSEETAAGALRVLTAAVGHVGGVDWRPAATATTTAAAAAVAPLLAAATATASGRRWSLSGPADDADSGTQASAQQQQLLLAPAPTRGAPSVPPPFHDRSLVGLAVSSLLALADGGAPATAAAPQALTSASSSSASLAPRARIGRPTRLAALRALAAVLAAVGRRGAAAVGAAPSLPPSLRPGPGAVSPFLPGLLGGLGRLALEGLGMAPAASPATASAATRRPASAPLAAAALTCLAAALELCLLQPCGGVGGTVDADWWREAARNLPPSLVPLLAAGAQRLFVGDDNDENESDGRPAGATPLRAAFARFVRACLGIGGGDSLAPVQRAAGDPPCGCCTEHAGVLAPLRTAAWDAALLVTTHTQLPPVVSAADAFGGDTAAAAALLVRVSDLTAGLPAALTGETRVAAAARPPPPAAPAGAVDIATGLPPLHFVTLLTRTMAAATIAAGGREPVVAALVDGALTACGSNRVSPAAVAAPPSTADALVPWLLACARLSAATGGVDSLAVASAPPPSGGSVVGATFDAAVPPPGLALLQRPGGASALPAFASLLLRLTLVRALLPPAATADVVTALVAVAALRLPPGSGVTQPHPPLQQQPGLCVAPASPADADSWRVAGLSEPTADAVAATYRQATEGVARDGVALLAAAGVPPPADAVAAPPSTALTVSTASSYGGGGDVAALSPLTLPPPTAAQALWLAAQLVAGLGDGLQQAPEAVAAPVESVTSPLPLLPVQPAAAFGSPLARLARQLTPLLLRSPAEAADAAVSRAAAAAAQLQRSPPPVLPEPADAPAWATAHAAAVSLLSLPRAERASGSDARLHRAAVALVAAAGLVRCVRKQSAATVAAGGAASGDDDDGEAGFSIRVGSSGGTLTDTATTKAQAPAAAASATATAALTPAHAAAVTAWRAGVGCEALRLLAALATATGPAYGSLLPRVLQAAMGLATAAVPAHRGGTGGGDGGETAATARLGAAAGALLATLGRACVLLPSGDAAPRQWWRAVPLPRPVAFDVPAQAPDSAPAAPVPTLSLLPPAATDSRSSALAAPLTAAAALTAGASLALALPAEVSSLLSAHLPAVTDGALAGLAALTAAVAGGAAAGAFAAAPPSLLGSPHVVRLLADNLALTAAHATASRGATDLALPLAVQPASTPLVVLRDLTAGVVSALAAVGGSALAQTPDDLSAPGGSVAASAAAALALGGGGGGAQTQPPALLEPSRAAVLAAAAPSGSSITVDLSRPLAAGAPAHTAVTAGRLAQEEAARAGVVTALLQAGASLVAATAAVGALPVPVGPAQDARLGAALQSWAEVASVEEAAATAAGTGMVPTAAAAAAAVVVPPASLAAGSASPPPPPAPLPLTLRLAAARLSQLAQYRRAFPQHHAAPPGDADGPAGAASPLPPLSPEDVPAPARPPDVVGDVLAAALPVLPPPPRDTVLALLTAAGAHVASAAALLSRDYDVLLAGATTGGADDGAASSRLGVLRLALAALALAGHAAVALARHPNALYPALHELWPAVAQLLPPATLALAPPGGAGGGGLGAGGMLPLAAAERVAAEDARLVARRRRGHSSGGIKLELRLAAALLPSVSASSNAGGGVSEEEEDGAGDGGLPSKRPAAAPSAPGGPRVSGSDVAEATRAYMTRRLAALRRHAEVAAAAAARAPVAATRQAATVVRTEASIGLPALAQQAAAATAGGGGGSLVPLSSVTASDPDALSHTRGNGLVTELGPQRISTSSVGSGDPRPPLTATALLVHAAALEFVTALAAAPLAAALPAEDGGGGGTAPLPPRYRLLLRGACAGNFLSSRFDAHVWPGLRAALIANVALVVAAATDAPRSGGGGGGTAADADADSSADDDMPAALAGLPPHARLIHSALRCVAQLARPVVTFTREPLEAGEDAADGGGGGGADGERDGAPAHAGGATSATSGGASSAIPRVPRFLPADAKARGKPHVPSTYTLGQPLLAAGGGRHGREVAALLAAARRAGAGVPRDSTAYPRPLAAATRAALAAMARHCNPAGVAHAVAVAAAGARA